MTKVSIQAKTNDGSSHIEESQIKVLSYREKLLACLLNWLAFMFVAFLSIFIPVAHFILVPLFIGLSFYFAYQAYSNSYELSGNDLKCPSCKKQMLNKSKKTKQSFRLFCNDCRMQIFYNIK